MQVVDPLADADWDRRLADLPETHVFHTRAWAAVLARAYGFPRAYAVMEEGGAWCALLPLMETRSPCGRKRAVALPFSDVVPIAAREPAHREALVEAIRREGASRRWRSVEFRGSTGIPLETPAARRFYRHQIVLIDDETRMFARMKATVRTAIRKAEANGVAAMAVPGAAALPDFCRLNALTRRRHGVPPQPARFFRALEQTLLQQGPGELWVARQSGRVIAVALFLTHGNRVTFKYGASDHHQQHLRANDLLMWRAMCAFAHRGFSGLCLGRTDLPHEGLRRFKLGLGAQEEQLAYHRFDFRSAAYEAGSEAPASPWYAGVVRIMPLWVNRRLGDVFYRFAA